MYYKKLVGKNIYLSPRRLEDAEQFTEWMNDFSTTDYLGRSNQLMTLEKEKEFLEKHIGDEATMNIVTLDEDKLIGTIGLENIDHLNRRAVLGIFIGDTEEREKGYGTEAINLILDYGFNYLNLNNIKLDVMEFNERAIACYKKCGFKEIGRRRKCEFIDGKYYDKVSMDILSEEFTGKYILNRNVNFRDGAKSSND